jgi:hypothetical protein
MDELLRRDLITAAQRTRGTNRLPGTVTYDPPIASTEIPLHFEAANADAERHASIGPAAGIAS